MPPVRPGNTTGDFVDSTSGTREAERNDRNELLDSSRDGVEAMDVGLLNGVLAMEGEDSMEHESRSSSAVSMLDQPFRLHDAYFNPACGCGPNFDPARFQSTFRGKLEQLTHAQIWSSLLTRMVECTQHGNNQKFLKNAIEGCKVDSCRITTITSISFVFTPPRCQTLLFSTPVNITAVKESIANILSMLGTCPNAISIDEPAVCVRCRLANEVTALHANATPPEEAIGETGDDDVEIDVVGAEETENTRPTMEMDQSNDGAEEIEDDREEETEAVDRTMDTTNQTNGRGEDVDGEEVEGQRLASRKVPGMLCCLCNADVQSIQEMYQHLNDKHAREHEETTYFLETRISDITRGCTKEDWHEAWQRYMSHGTVYTMPELKQLMESCALELRDRHASTAPVESLQPRPDQTSPDGDSEERPADDVDPEFNEMEEMGDDVESEGGLEERRIDETASDEMEETGDEGGEDDVEGQETDTMASRVKTRRGRVNYAESDDGEQHEVMVTGGMKPAVVSPGKRTPNAAMGQRKAKTKRNSKGHPCPDCERVFKHPSKLTAHRTTHSDAKPHKCNECGKAYKQADRLNTHLNEQHGINAFSCPVCKELFATAAERKSHRNGRHKKQWVSGKDGKKGKYCWV